MVRFVMELEGLQQEKQDVISRAVAYYREALAEKNPFQRITTLLSCIQVIVRDVVQENEVKPRHIYDVLDDYVKLERKQSRDYYGKFRSAAAHGQEDILDSSKIREAEEIAEKVLMITFRLIREYAKRNRQQQQQQESSDDDNNSISSELYPASLLSEVIEQDRRRLAELVRLHEEEEQQQQEQSNKRARK